MKHNIPQGTYFVMADITDFLSLPRFRGWSDLQFCEWMTREIGVAFAKKAGISRSNALEFFIILMSRYC